MVAVSDEVTVDFSKGEPYSPPVIGDLGMGGLALVIVLVAIIVLAVVAVRRRESSSAL